MIFRLNIYNVYVTMFYKVKLYIYKLTLLSFYINIYLFIKFKLLYILYAYIGYIEDLIYERMKFIFK